MGSKELLCKLGSNKYQYYYQKPGYTLFFFFVTAKKCMFLVNINKTLALTSFSLLIESFPYEIHLQRSPKFNIVAAILNSTWQPWRIFVTSFHPRDFRH